MKNQNENQFKNQIEKNLINQNEKNLCIRLFKEQIDLINELPEGEREKVLYIAVVNAFKTFDENYKKSNLNQIENQNENAYISVSVSVSYYLNQLSISLSNISKTVLNLLKKTLEVKEFSSNLGGKRPGAGRKKQEKPVINISENYVPAIIDMNYEPIKKKTDPFTNPLIDKCFEIYKTECPNLLKLGFEPRNRKIREDVCSFLDEIDADIGYFTELCRKANKLKEIVHKSIDFKMLIKNHIGIFNGKYKDNDTFDYNEWLKEQGNESG